jgi:hypothetical protein
MTPDQALPGLRAERRRKWLVYAFAAFWLLLGIVRLWDGGDTESIVLGVSYLAIAVVWFIRAPTIARQWSPPRSGAKPAEWEATSEKDELPRWFSPDNPPGWYRNPANGEPRYWSNNGWRRCG